MNKSSLMASVALAAAMSMQHNNAAAVRAEERPARKPKKNGNATKRKMRKATNAKRKSGRKKK